MVLVITVVLCTIAVLVVGFALIVTLRSRRRWLQASRSFERTVRQVRKDQALLAEGLVPEFAVDGDVDEMKRRYLAGEDIPLRWRNR